MAASQGSSAAHATWFATAASAVKKKIGGCTDMYAIPGSNVRVSSQITHQHDCSLVIVKNRCKHKCIVATLPYCVGCLSRTHTHTHTLAHTHTYTQVANAQTVTWHLFMLN